ncbi:hypothetical protein [Plantactinospora sp. BB1]|uniref:hypothetical protein n=1 Tax=Plantactinospora sp. BB1 TaxID=2071627 RepID=UPI000D17C931|nr:hypothetical protein [Plantactinospora sp. BB1]AVT40279.1 hypothetical protein C6W10_31805 [Plantactinospora sp. BB1]
MTDEFLDLTGGDVGRSKALQENLSRLAKESDGLLREMAKAVLAGELTLRDAASNDVYGAELIDRSRDFWTTYKEMSPEEQADLAARGQQHLDELAD